MSDRERRLGERINQVLRGADLSDGCSVLTNLLVNALQSMGCSKETFVRVAIETWDHVARSRSGPIVVSSVIPGIE